MRSASPVRRRSAATAAAALAALAVVAGCSSGGTPTSGPPSAQTSAPPSTVSVAPTTPPATPTPTAAATSAALASFYDQKLKWRTCGGFECATLRVPLRYEAPDPSKVIKLDLLRNPASSSSKRIGSLVVNPGGPGGSGIGYAQRSDSVLPAAVRARYDIVGFDPRGVQSSSPNVNCITDKQLDRYISSDTSVDNAAAQLRDARMFADGCAKRSPELYPHVGTHDAAKDLDLLRAALGEKKLDYLGKSYGTLLGITYAETFPGRAGRMVLDGVLDPSLDAESLLRGQAAGFERAYKAFVANCVRTVSCPLGKTEKAAYDRTLRWIDGLEAEPLGGNGPRELTKPLAQLAILGSLYEDRSQWATLRSALRSGLAGRPAAMLALADSAVDRQPGGRYPDNSNEAQYAITCLDRPYTATVVQTADRAERFATFAPLFGEYIAWGDLPCTEWKTAPTRQPHRITADLPPLLLIGVSRDPATPLSWAESLRDQLPDSRLVSWKADGHTGYFRGSGCVDAIAGAYLLEGKVPATDKTCTGR